MNAAQLKRMSYALAATALLTACDASTGPGRTDAPLATQVTTNVESDGAQSAGGVQRASSGAPASGGGQIRAASRPGNDYKPVGPRG